MVGVLEGALHLGLDGGQRNHLAGNLGEALGAALDGDKAEIGSMSTISPVSYQPSGGGSSTPGIVGAQVAEHNIGALDDELAAVIDAIDSFQFVLKAIDAFGQLCQS